MNENAGGAAAGAEGPDRLLRVLLAWTLVTLVPFWLILTRAGIEPDQYAWGLPGLGAAGRGEAFWVIVLLAAFGLGVLYLGLRGARPPFHFLFVVWHVVLAATVAIEVLGEGGLAVSGDAWGFRFRIGYLALAVPVGFAAAAIGWAVRDLRRMSGGRVGTRETRPNRYASRLYAAAVLLALPMAVLFRTGENYGTGDEIAVGLTILQFLLLYAAFHPARRAAAPSPVTPDR